MRLSVDDRALLVPIGIILNVLGCWVHWEAVVKPLKTVTGAWGRDFPAPFYLFRMPIWLWHDLAYTLIITGTLILAYYALRGKKEEINGKGGHGSEY